MRRIASIVASMGLIGLILSFVGPALTAQADVNCTFTADDITAINAIQNNPDLTTSAEITQELHARQALLGRVIACAKNDAQNLETSLQNAQVPSDATQLQSQLVDQLNEAMTYYDLETTKLNNAGIAGTQSIAREILAWRRSNYDILSAQVANFTLWSSNQAVFATANTRLTQTGKVVSFIESVAPNGQLSAQLATAENLLQNANSENAAAKNALLQSLSPDQSSALLQESLQSLSDAYKQFLVVSASIETVLPTTNGNQ